MRREGRPRLALLLSALLLLAICGEPARVEAKAAGLGPFDARLAAAARQGAMRRLRSPDCQRILTDFSDASGRSLAENLESFALPVDEYLAKIVFFDGTGYRSCEAGAELFTTVGGHRVFVCKRFLNTAYQRRAQAEIFVIHEMLHTLGLGENPPSSQEITDHVKRRCEG